MMNGVYIIAYVNSRRKKLAVKRELVFPAIRLVPGDTFFAIHKTNIVKYFEKAKMVVEI